ncbi:phage portal protein, partial [Plesiomonas shigelloides]
QSTGFLSSENALNKEQRERLRKSLQSFIGSKNAGKLMVLENKLSYQNVTMNPEAAQLLESRAFSIEEICRWFRVPPFMVGHMTKQNSWAASVEGMNLLFLTNTLRPLLVNIEQEIARCLLGDDEDYFAEFSVEGLLRADSAGRAAYYTTALQNGWMSRNDVRRLENLPPIPGGDIYTVQLNLTPLEDLKKNNLQSLALHNFLFPDIPPEQSPLKNNA